MDGQTLRTSDFQSGEIEGENGYTNPGIGFFFEGRHFSADGTVRDKYPHEPNDQTAVWGENRAFAETVPSGTLVEERFKDKSGEAGTLLLMACACSGAVAASLGSIDTITS